jgi:hypothetical protein
VTLEKGKLSELLPLDDESGPAPRISTQHALDLVNSALDEWASPESGFRGKTVRPKSNRRRWLYLSGAALTIAGSAAAAHYFSASREPDAGSIPIAPAIEPPKVDPNPRVPETRLEEPPSVETPGSHRPVGAATDVRPVPTDTAEDFLRRGNQLRADGRFREAEQAYAEVFRRYPGSASAYVARVAAATIRLEKLGDARGARKLFRAAGHGGALDIEVWKGLAAASRALSDRRGEIDALSGLVEAHPGSSAAKLAEKRLADLGGR